jgi:hypothetical protein
VYWYLSVYKRGIELGSVPLLFCVTVIVLTDRYCRIMFYNGEY